MINKVPNDTSSGFPVLVGLGLAGRVSLWSCLGGRRQFKSLPLPIFLSSKKEVSNDTLKG